eukprot:CAMPEP_0202102664 /NCGR_PEP_ID=MMETSP0965-20130614/4444_1 /ASSEMBLY_ACC=CAM_ASM_000507 /TAXON_ID=4773 /ORGANISM="Schizochytrium aggregatum, Strain ATCC28209" /LENGTH=360 /DNA_ID=CAMNT_0048671439 /DNA_START=37 /DNA_END=1119 /DNA_ORIENTATION=+
MALAAAVARAARGAQARGPAAARALSTTVPLTMRAVQVRNTGAAEVLREDAEVPVPQPGPGEILVRNDFTGLNFIDTYHRSGLYATKLPFTLGVEGAGQVMSRGDGVPDDKFSVGERVCYYGTGSYAEYTVVPMTQAVGVWDEISQEDAVTCVTQGMTAHCLARSTFPLAEGDTAFIQAAAGGTGQLLVQIAKIMGARVIGTSSTPKLDLGYQCGADIMLPYDQLSHDEIVQAVKEATDGRGASVAYDGVGLRTFEMSLNSLRPRGCCVLFGNASGPVPPIDPLTLTSKGSLFLTRPKFYDYIESQEDLQTRMDELFKWVLEGKLKTNVQKVFRLADAAEAHRFIEGGNTVGKVLIDTRK